MKGKTLVVVLSAVVTAACQDSVRPNARPILEPKMAASIYDSILGPTFLAIGETGTWGWSPPWDWPTMVSYDIVDGPYLGTGFSGVSYAASSDFTLHAQAWHNGTLHHRWLSVDVWTACDPAKLHPDPAYCDAKISTTPDGAAQYEQCHWFVVTNMPIASTVVKWYVNDQLLHTGPDFDYSHQLNEGFDIFMTAENPNFGARNQHKWIPVGPQYTCNM